MRSSVYQELLAGRSEFGECLLLDYWSENLCRDFVALISDIRDERGNIRLDLDTLQPVHLRFSVCRRIYIENDLPDSLVSHLDKMNWGYNEFSSLRVVGSEEGWLRFRFQWEGARRIDIECQSFEMTRGEPSRELQERYPW